VKNKILILALFFSVSCSTIDQTKLDNEFIKVKNIKFIKNGKPYYFVGTNFWYGCYLGSPGETGDRERLKLELDMLKSQNIDNLRILAASEESTIKRSLTPAVQTSLGIYNQDLLEGLDFLLSQMNKRDMHAVIFGIIVKKCCWNLYKVL
jgi:mannan endo-1,4-beta-mannosidase